MFMSNARRFWSGWELPLVLLFCLLTLASARPVDAATGPQLLQQGQILIEANCADCMGATKEKLLQGIGKVGEALRQGIADEAAAYHALARGYMVLAYVYAPPDSAEMKLMQEKQQSALKRATELDPHNTEILDEYASTFTDPKDAVAVWRRILAIDPSHQGALFGAGRYEVTHGEVEEGLVKMRKAFETSSGAMAYFYGTNLQWTLSELGRNEEALKVKKIVELLPRE